MSSRLPLQLTVSGHAVAETFGCRGGYEDSPELRRALDHRILAFNALTETAGWQFTKFSMHTGELYDAISIAVATCPIGIPDQVFDLQAFLDQVLLMRPFEGRA